MNTEGPNVGSSLTTDPKYGKASRIVEFQKFAFMDSTDSKLTFDGADERRALEQCAGEIFYCAGELGFVFEVIVET
jgi:hypothetical protein